MRGNSGKIRGKGFNGVKDIFLNDKGKGLKGEDPRHQLRRTWVLGVQESGPK